MSSPPSELNWRETVSDIRRHYGIGFGTAGTEAEVVVVSSEEVRAATVVGPTCYSRRAAAELYHLENTAGTAVSCDMLKYLPTVPLVVPSEEAVDVVREIAEDLHMHSQLKRTLRRLKGTPEPEKK